MLNDKEGIPKPGHLIDLAMEKGIKYEIIYLMGYNELLKTLEVKEVILSTPHLPSICLIDGDRQTWMRDN